MEPTEWGLGGPRQTPGFQRSNVSLIVANPSWLLNPLSSLVQRGNLPRSGFVSGGSLYALDILREHEQPGDAAGLLGPVSLLPRGMLGERGQVRREAGPDWVSRRLAYPVSSTDSLSPFYLQALAVGPCQTVYTSPLPPLQVE